MECLIILMSKTWPVEVCSQNLTEKIPDYRYKEDRFLDLGSSNIEPVPPEITLKSIVHSHGLKFPDAISGCTLEAGHNFNKETFFGIAIEHLGYTNEG